MSLWRTQRSQFPQYAPNGHGRDYYITYNNAGLWANIHPIEHAPNYERVKYNNFHSLIHRTYPVKYFADGKGRENYILQSKGMINDEKPMCSFNLSDFLRMNNFKGYNGKIYKSRDERKYNSQLGSLEKSLITRLYPKTKKNMNKITKSEGKYKDFNEKINKNQTLKIGESKDFENNKNNVIKSNLIYNFPTITKKKMNRSIQKKGKHFNSCLNTFDNLIKQSQKIEKYEFEKFTLKKKNNDDEINTRISKKILNPLINDDLNKKIKEEDKFIYYLKTERNEDKKKKQVVKNLFQGHFNKDKNDM